MVLLLAFKQYGIELFSIKTKLQLLPDCFSAAFALTLSIGRQIQFQYVSANYTKTTIADGSIFTFLFISPFCVFFLFYNRFIYQCQNWKHFYCSKHRLSLQENIFILYCLLVLCWLPYLLALYPGVVLPDSLSSVAQSMGDVPISNHHPVLFTLLVKLFVHDLPTDTINHGVFYFRFSNIDNSFSDKLFSLLAVKRNIHFSGTH